MLWTRRGGGGRRRRPRRRWIIILLSYTSSRATSNNLELAFEGESGAKHCSARSVVGRAEDPHEEVPTPGECELGNRIADCAPAVDHFFDECGVVPWRPLVQPHCDFKPIPSLGCAVDGLDRITSAQSTVLRRLEHAHHTRIRSNTSRAGTLNKSFCRNRVGRCRSRDGGCFAIPVASGMVICSFSALTGSTIISADWKVDTIVPCIGQFVVHLADISVVC